MSKVTVTDLVNLNNDNSVVTTINNNFHAIQTAIDLLLSRDGTSPNTLSADIDFNGQTGINVKAPVLNGDLVRLVDLGDTVAAADSATAALASQVAAASSAASAATSATTAVTAGSISLPYTFSTTTSDADPGNGTLRLSNATQNLSTVIRADLLDNATRDWSTVLATFADSTNTVKGHINLFLKSDPTKFLIFTVSALASPSGYKNITVANVTSSTASPFANGDTIVLVFTRAGDKGASGSGSGDMVTTNNLSDLTNAGTARTNLGVAIGTNVQAFDSDLSALAANASTGLWAVTGGGTGAVRTITGSQGVAVTNGGGVAGAPALSVDITTLTTDSSPDTSADYVMTYDASAAVNKKVLLSGLSGKIAPDFFAYGKKSEGTDAGSAVAGNNSSIAIETVARNALSWTVAATSVTLPTGTYWVEWGVPAYKVNSHRSVLNSTPSPNITITPSNGQTAQSGSADTTMTYSNGAAFVTATVSTHDISLATYCQTARATDGLGLASPGTFGTGDGEHFAWIKIWKIS